MKELITALVKAQNEFPPISKNKSNPYHKSRYADLDSILEVVTPILCKHDLAIVQMPETDFSVTYTHSETEKGITTEFTHPGILLRTRLYHTSGDFIESTYPLQFDPNPQKRGSDVTYARRYALCALLSITADTDDDGNGASKWKPGQPTPNQAKTDARKTELLNQAKEFAKALGMTPEDRSALMNKEFKGKPADKLSIDELEALVAYLQNKHEGINA